jgi:hypothetical protein
VACSHAANVEAPPAAAAAPAGAAPAAGGVLERARCGCGAPALAAGAAAGFDAPAAGLAAAPRRGERGGLGMRDGSVATAEAVELPPTAAADLAGPPFAALLGLRGGGVRRAAGCEAGAGAGSGALGAAGASSTVTGSGSWAAEGWSNRGSGGGALPRTRMPRGAASAEGPGTGSAWVVASAQALLSSCTGAYPADRPGERWHSLLPAKLLQTAVRHRAHRRP